MDNITPEKSPYMVSAHLFMRGKDLNPDEITKLLGVVPEMEHKTGDQHGENREMTWKSGFWLIDTKPLVVSQDVEHHIVWILDHVENVTDELQGIRSREGVYMELKIIISLFRRNWNGVLSPKTLKRLSGLNIPFSFAISYLAYPAEEE